MKKQRFYCKSCTHTFSVHSSKVEKTGLFQTKSSSTPYLNLLNLSEELKETYRFYESILYALKDKKFFCFRVAFQNSAPHCSNIMKVSRRTLQYHTKKCHIEMAFGYGYSNGPLEGTNNKM
ncbi:transposase [Marinilactibacillus psychrotolerans]|uniref:transposase n=1 Tax=Marinilactibacillus psychrotolerans TaxID=191770 RepID=UPI00388520A6